MTDFTPVEIKVVTENDVFNQIEKRYAQPEYAIFRQVANSTGFSVTNYADAIAISLWPSRGLKVIGFEIKVNRTDWLSEKKKPQKAERIAQYCDEWWVVAPEGVVREEEMPEKWGLYKANAERLTVVKKAEALSPVPLTREFVACVLRRAYEHHKHTIEPDEFRERVNARVEERIAEKEKRFKEEITRMENWEKEREQKMEEFEKKLGVSLNVWNLPPMAEAINLAKKLRDHENDLKELKEHAERALAEIAKLRGGEVYARE